MPETVGTRGAEKKNDNNNNNKAVAVQGTYVEMAH
jgi:hypothetical protein